MKQSTKRRIVLFIGLIVLPVSLAQVAAGQAKRGITGDWQLKVDYDGRRQMSSILSLSEDDAGKLKGELVNFWGLSELRDIEHEGNELSFVQVFRFRDQERTTKFTGSVQRGKLSGTFSSDRGDSQVEGARLRPMPPVVGEWELAFTIGDREVTTNLTVKSDEQRQLTADWKSQWGEHEITNLAFKAGKLTFDRKSKFQDRQFESSFEGKIKGHALSGTIKSDMGEVAVEGKRLGAAAIGLWELDIASDSGNVKQLLRINPDLSAMYGPLSVEKVDLDDSKIAFKAAVDFGQSNYEMSFAGQIEGRKLTGELTSSRGAREVTGQRRPPMGARQKAARAVETKREPDVIYVPTPQAVVDKMLELAQVTKDDLIYDLGCGDGRIVVTAAKRYGCRAVGFDIDPKRIEESLANVEKENVGHLVRIEQRDIFTLDLSKANVITLYLLPSLNVKLIPQLEKLKPGSRIVSHDFDMRGVKPDNVITIGDEGDEYGDHTVYLWTTPLKKENVSDE